MNEWIRQWFDGGDAMVARRALDDVERMASLDEAIDLARERGWHLIETEGQIVLLRHEGALRVHC